MYDKKKFYIIDLIVVWSLILLEGILEKGYKLELYVYGCVSWNSLWCDLF